MLLQKLLKSTYYNGLSYTVTKAVFILCGLKDEQHTTFLETKKKAYQMLHEKKSLQIIHFLKDILLVFDNTGKEQDSYIRECEQLFKAEGLSYSTVMLDEVKQYPFQDFSCVIFYQCKHSGKMQELCEMMNNNHQKVISVSGDSFVRQDGNEGPMNIDNESPSKLLQILYAKKPHIAFVLPSTYISGGVMVVLTHAAFLQDCGWKVTILVSVDNKESGEDTFYCGRHFYTLNYLKDIIDAEFDIMIATQWGTVDFVQKYKRAKRKMYFVQNYETDFYSGGDLYRISAEATYHKKSYLEYYTMSRWCQKWLKNNYGISSEYIPNGIFTELFHREKRNLTDRKIRILIEGDCVLACKNVDESFRIVAKLDSRQFEVWYLSYNGRPKDWYKVDQFFHKILYQDVHKIYEQCDILIKSSVLESFSYPPLEMMATGGYVVLVENEGNTEYIKNEINCLTYPQGDIAKAVGAVQRICTDAGLRNVLYTGACMTADSHDWSCYEKEIIELYSSRCSSIRKERDNSRYGVNNSKPDFPC